MLWEKQNGLFQRLFFVRKVFFLDDRSNNRKIFSRINFLDSLCNVLQLCHLFSVLNFSLTTFFPQKIWVDHVGELLEVSLVGKTVFALKGGNKIPDVVARQLCCVETSIPRFECIVCCWTLVENFVKDSPHLRLEHRGTPWTWSSSPLSNVRPCDVINVVKCSVGQVLWQTFDKRLDGFVKKCSDKISTAVGQGHNVNDVLEGRVCVVDLCGIFLSHGLPKVCLEVKQTSRNLLKNKMS